MNKFDFSTLIGIAAGILLIFFSIGFSSTLSKYLNFPSFLIVIGGTFCVSAACFSFSELGQALKSITSLVIYAPANPSLVAVAALRTAEQAYKNGIITLNNTKSLPLQNSLFNKWLTLAIDREKTTNIEKLTTQEIYAIGDQHQMIIQLIKKAAEVAPALGLIGTLIGLVHMLSNINDLSQVGPGMSVALLTTFYGAILAYIILFPLASKLESNLKLEMLNFDIYQKTVISIVQNENPRQLEVMLNSILPPSKQIIYYKY